MRCWKKVDERKRLGRLFYGVKKTIKLKKNWQNETRRKRKTNRDYATLKVVKGMVRCFKGGLYDMMVGALPTEGPAGG